MNTTSKPRRHASCPKRLCQVRFADACGELNEHGLVPLDKPAGRQVEELLTIDRGVKGEIEALERLPEIDRRAAEAELQLLLRTPLDFVFHQPLEEVHIGQLLGNGLLRADLERRQNAREPEILQFRHELMIQLHDPPPVGGKKSVTGRANTGALVGAAIGDAAGKGV